MKENLVEISVLRSPKLRKGLNKIYVYIQHRREKKSIHFHQIHKKNFNNGLVDALRLQHETVKETAGQHWRESNAAIPYLCVLL